MLSSKAIKVGYYLISQRKLLSRYERWRRMAKSLKLSKSAYLRLEWLIYYETTAQKNVQLTCRYFDIARKNFLQVARWVQ